MSRLPKLGLIVPDAWELTRIEAYARAADELGFWGIFPFEERGYDCTVMLGHLAGMTRNVVVGSCIVSVFVRSATICAMAANTVAAIAPGRFILGLGTSPPFVVEHMHHGAFDKPVGRVKDYARIARAILTRDGPIAHQGSAVGVEHIQLSVPRPSAPVPIYVAAIGPQMIEAAGEVADGVFLSTLASPEYIQAARAALARGAQKAGRDASGIVMSAPIVTSVDRDERRALDAARAMVAYFAVVYYFQAQLEQAGWGEAGKRIRQANKKNGFHEAVKLVPDEMVRSLTVAGTPEQCGERLAELGSWGLDAVILNPPSPRPVFGQPGVSIPVHPYEHAEQVPQLLGELTR